MIDLSVRRRWKRRLSAAAALLLALACPGAFAASLNLANAVVVVRSGQLPDAEKTAAAVLVEEVQKRTGIQLPVSTAWPPGRTVIALAGAPSPAAWKHSPSRLPGSHPEGFRLYAEASPAAPVVWILGRDARGALFGVGDFLRRMDWSQGKLSLDSAIDVNTSPAYAIRGHQLGYRAQANSYDAWSPQQFEQYIRELTFFGVNAIEGIPFQDERPTPVMKWPRRDMNRKIGEICKRYGLDYWVWVPADFSLNDKAKRAHLLAQCDEFFHDTPELTGFSFPGGDPGDNPPELVMPFLEDVAKLLAPAHPHAKIWLSVQQYKASQTDYVFDYIKQREPEWLGGLVAGPSSPPLREMRERLPQRYQLRDYPDLTHNKLCQYEVPEWDQAFALTLGREAVNPRPVEYAAVFERTAGYTDGFISYSDGIHDDVNKTIWSALSWDPSETPRDILIDYARVYFTSAAPRRIADGILGLERNWRGPAAVNGAVDGTLRLWRELEKLAPQLESNWRWQMCLLRANYDEYVRKRLIYETELEDEANGILANAAKLGSVNAMIEAAAVLDGAASHPVHAELRTRIVALCDLLFHSIGLQSSVAKYHAIGEERGAVLDFVDYPLNNRWWLEDQFQRIRGLGAEPERVQELTGLARWEHPGPGSFYDVVGDIAKSPRVVRCDPQNGPELKRARGTTFWWWDQGKSRERLSFQVSSWPEAIVYEALDPKSGYVVRTHGYGQSLLRINGERVEPAKGGDSPTAIQEFPVNAKYLSGRRLVLTWDPPANEEHLNWRKHSRLSEVWLIRKD